MTNHNSSSRRTFDTLTSAHWSIIADLVDVDVVDVDLDVDLVDAVGDVQGAVHRSAKQKKLTVDLVDVDLVDVDLDVDFDSCNMLITRAPEVHLTR